MEAQSKPVPSKEPVVGETPVQQGPLRPPKEILAEAQAKRREREAQDSAREAEMRERCPLLSPPATSTSAVPSDTSSQVSMEVDQSVDEQESATRASQPRAGVATGSSSSLDSQPSTAGQASVSSHDEYIREHAVWEMIPVPLPAVPVFDTPGEHPQMKTYLPTGSIVGVYLSQGRMSGEMRYVRIGRPSMLRITPRLREPDAPQPPPATSQPQPGREQGQEGAGGQDTATAVPSPAPAPTTSDTTVVSPSDAPSESTITRL